MDGWERTWGDAGWRLLAGAVPVAAIAQILVELAAAVADGAAAHGMRDALTRSPAVRALADRLAATAGAALGAEARLIRGLLLDKTPSANWRVPWHQDIAAAFAARREVDGFHAWTEKLGVAHADPPEPWASRRVALRVHLDACPADAGPLRLLPGTHRDGRLAPAAVAARVAAVAPVTVLAARGDVLVMHPLLLHASAPARRPGRRVLHLEYVDAALALPGGLAWATP